MIMRNIELEIHQLMKASIGLPVDEVKASIDTYANSLLGDYSEYTVETKGHSCSEKLTVSEAVSKFRWFPDQKAIIDSVTNDLVDVVARASTLSEEDLEGRLLMITSSYIGWLHKGEINLLSACSERVIKCCNCDNHMRFSAKPMERKVVLADYIEPCSVSMSDLTDVQIINIPSGKLALMDLDDFREYVPQQTRKKFMSSGYSLSSITGVKSFNKVLSEQDFGSVAMHHDCHAVSVIQNGDEVSLVSIDAFDEDLGGIEPEGAYLTTIGQGVFFVDLGLLAELADCSPESIHTQLVINLKPGRY
ncbi:hypothetical protein LMH73_020330, partial [Vibrio splendidus]